MKAFHSEAHRRHDPERFLFRGRPAPYPERPERAERLLAALHGDGVEIAMPAPFEDACLAAVHTPDYLKFLRDGYGEWIALPDASPEMIPNTHPGRHWGTRPEGIVGQAGYYLADGACPVGPGTWAAARESAEVALSAVQAVLDGADAAYALCRPPGHHAASDLAGGFCFLNNVAIAAAQAVRAGRRPAILDVDVHHGNGTQAIFYRRADVFFASLHGDPSAFYPFFCGYAHERGEGPGEGYNLNLPLPPGSGDNVFLDALARAQEAVALYGADLLCVSLGLDAQENDPLGNLKVTTDGFRRIGAAIGGQGLPTAIVQEGGYLCPELGDNLRAFLDGFRSAR